MTDLAQFLNQSERVLAFVLRFHGQHDPRILVRYKKFADAVRHDVARDDRAERLPIGFDFFDLRDGFELLDQFFFLVVMTFWDQNRIGVFRSKDFADFFFVVTDLRPRPEDVRCPEVIVIVIGQHERRHDGHRKNDHGRDHDFLHEPPEYTEVRQEALVPRLVRPLAEHQQVLP